MRRGMVPHHHILIVDPDREKAAEYRCLFAQDDCDVETAYTLRGAVSLMRHVRFGCIVMDVDLPDMAGYDAVSVVKTIEPNVSIVMTALKNTKELEARVREEDIFYYYIKAFDPEELRLAVRSGLTAAHSRDFAL